MSTYALDQERNALMVFWETGRGCKAATVGELGDDVPDEAGQHLAHALTAFAAQAWRTYTHPASAAGDLDVNSEGWRREEYRAAFSEVSQALAKPNLPADGGLIVSYNPVEESAHQVGRALHDINKPELTERIVAEVETELAAIEQAELGDLSGRARQAVALTRAGASPAQVHAADQIMSTAPLGSMDIFTEVEPVAAAIAAAHWLKAAADVAAEASGLEPTRIVEEADNIEALGHETPTIVLEQLEAGASPYETVTGLIRDAMIVAEGAIPDLQGLLGRVADADDAAERHNDPSLRDALISELRTTPLDPRRPAQDLLEDLLDGLRGCWLIYQEDAPEDEDAFVDDVRQEATATRERLV